MQGAVPDPATILASLGIDRVDSVAPVTGGLDTSIWRVERAGERYALRLFRAEQWRAFERELTALQLAAASGLPVPAVVAAGRWAERPVMLQAWLPGRLLRHELLRRPRRAWRLGLAFGRMQARLHALTAPASLHRGGDGWLDWAGPIPPALRHRLLALGPRFDALLHLDYHPLNVLTDGRRITGVLDWTNALAGDPRADIARTATLLRLPVDPTPGGTRRDGRPRAFDSLRRIFVHAWWCGYREIAGPVPDLAPFYAWAGTVLANDLGPKARPDSWLTPDVLAAIVRWSERRGGLLSPGPSSPGTHDA
jgi:aminoglycoside phosphotransferase (APT) family kinase protein